jgi:hypothetical protein
LRTRKPRELYSKQSRYGDVPFLLLIDMLVSELNMYLERT